jgi:hypothetical protein
MLSSVSTITPILPTGFERSWPAEAIRLIGHAIGAPYCRWHLPRDPRQLTV